ncbi:metal ABC transporter solute-binding protein, Zn/Mn family [Aerococcus viridans]|uniref:Metal transporter n=1 Tax=Aerococcus viridans TaxID=1377 RepID=A0A2J9PLY5_9LACT|nr:zinc ABC transporter substrate-binding protein [Aerococcus viridans]MCT1798258.1 zinc ABC transporter substrate-binding protein [Aerococcus viridans]PNL91345.1 metal transporter [Aerococcus viridans]
MKKIWTLLSVMVVALILGACASGRDSASDRGDVADEKPVVTVSTSFLRDMVEQLARDQVTVETIIPAGEDPHGYLARPDDLKKIQGADLVLYHGLHLEAQMVKALEATGVAVTKDFTEEDLTMVNQDGESEVDPHFWFDITLYQKAVDTVAAELVSLTGDESINDAAMAYKEELTELDIWAQAEIDSIPEGQRYLITPHDAFNYFSQRYGIEVVAPQGISTQSEASNADISAIASFIVENEVPAIFAESTTDPTRMQRIQEAVSADSGEVTVVSGEGQELFSDSLASEGQEGDTYIDMLKHNVNLIVSNLK